MPAPQQGGYDASRVPMPPPAAQQTTVIQMGGHKNVAVAVLLAFFFGPLGMLYSTVTGALVMLVVNILVAIVTLGLGLLLTLPICAIWAAVAANSHNNRLGGQPVHQVGIATTYSTYSTPAAWHDDPAGSGRLRYYDGIRWTGHYAEKPAAAAPAPEITTEVAKTTEAAGTNEVTETTEVTEVAAPGSFCGACGASLEANDRFCPACGSPQAAS